MPFTNGRCSFCNSCDPQDRRMGGAKRYPSILPARRWVSLRSTHPTKLECDFSFSRRVSLPARLPLTIVRLRLHLTAAPLAWIYRLGFRTAPAEEAPAVVAPIARNEDIGRGLARDKAALGLIAQDRDELGAIVGLAAQRLVRDDDR